jgi:hypothetical protein
VFGKSAMDRLMVKLNHRHAGKTNSQLQQVNQRRQGAVSAFALLLEEIDAVEKRVKALDLICDTRMLPTVYKLQKDAMDELWDMLEDSRSF